MRTEDGTSTRPRIIVLSGVSRSLNIPKFVTCSLIPRSMKLSRDHSPCGHQTPLLCRTNLQITHLEFVWFTFAMSHNTTDLLEQSAPAQIVRRHISHSPRPSLTLYPLAASGAPVPRKRSHPQPVTSSVCYAKRNSSQACLTAGWIVRD